MSEFTILANSTILLLSFMFVGDYDDNAAPASSHSANVERWRTFYVNVIKNRLRVGRLGPKP